MARIQECPAKRVPPLLVTFITPSIVALPAGAEFSRPAAAIIAEARRLIAAGAREIALLGQNVNAYRGEAPAGGVWGLAALLTALAEIPGLARLRYTTSHPVDVDDALIAAHRDLPQLMPFLHLPVQSGSDRVLKAMNRRHGADDYRRVVDRLRQARNDLALSSDFIVGFPGESPADFAATLALVRDIGYAQSFSFKHSPRPGTPAALMAEQIPDAVQTERLAELQALLAAQQRAYNTATLGRVLPVLFEKRGRHGGQLVGRSPYFQGVHAVAPEALLGAIAAVRMIHIEANSLTGAIAASAAETSP